VVVGVDIFLEVERWVRKHNNPDVNLEGLQAGS